MHIELNFGEVGCKGVAWDTDQWPAVVNTVMSF
jgi:hypothetical protein